MPCLWNRISFCFAVVLAAVLAFNITHAQESQKGSDEYEDDKSKEAETKEFEDTEIRTGVTSEEAEAIDKSIIAGAEWLKKQQNEDGQFEAFEERHWVGGQALALLTMLKCDIPYDDPSIEKGKDWLYKYYRKGWYDRGAIANQVKTYASGLILMFLETYYQKPVKIKEEKEDRNGDGIIDVREAEKWKKYQEKLAEARKTIRYRSVQSGDKSWIKSLQRDLVSTQAETTGVWGYPGHGAYGKPDDKDRQSGKAGEQIYGDYSNTQYAMLGLKAASRLGFQCREEKVYLRLAKFLVSSQEPKGVEVKRTRIIKPRGKHSTASARTYKKTDNARGWTYTGYFQHKQSKEEFGWFTGSMTTAALACLVICKSELLELRKMREGDDLDNQINQSIWDGIAWMGHNFSVRTNPRSKAESKQQSGAGNAWHYYYLYGLERAGILAGRDFFGLHEWYPEGAREIVADQREDGSWSGRVPKKANIPEAGKEYQLHDTCFALLFLKRATMPIENPPPPSPITGTGHTK